MNICLSPFPGVQIVENAKIKVVAADNFTSPPKKKMCKGLDPKKNPAKAMDVEKNCSVVQRSLGGLCLYLVHVAHMFREHCTRVGRFC